jgi:hypothetical protein
MSGFRFEPLSFLIGFITASVLAFILYRLRHRIARMREQAAERAERARRFATRAADARYQLDLVAYCQQYTIVGRRVELSEVLVEPRFVRGIQPYDASGERRLTDVFRVIPLVHEFPAPTHRTTSKLSASPTWAQATAIWRCWASRAAVAAQLWRQLLSGP